MTQQLMVALTELIGAAEALEIAARLEETTVNSTLSQLTSAFKLHAIATKQLAIEILSLQEAAQSRTSNVGSSHSS